MMIWIFLSILAICITVIAWKYIDENGTVDLFSTDRRIANLEKQIMALEKTMEGFKRGGAE